MRLVLYFTVFYADYICNAEDYSTIESILSQPKNNVLVDIQGITIEGHILECLLYDNRFLEGDVSICMHGSMFQNDFLVNVWNIYIYIYIYRS